MRNFLSTTGFALLSLAGYAQDSLKTTSLNEVVVTGTKFDVAVEKSGKSIYKLTHDDLQRNAGKSLADVLQEVPGLQMDGNFSTPGANISYYLRGARNKSTLILIDGVPLNDPSAINAEYDLRYIPISQIESIEVLKGGLSTLYGTNAAAGVISIKLKQAASAFQGLAGIEVSSFNTFQQNVQISGRNAGFSYLAAADNVRSRGFSAALDTDPNQEFDRDGFSRQNALVKLGYTFNPQWEIGAQAAYEQFEADYDAFEFTDASNVQIYDQFRLGINGKYTYSKGTIEGKVFHNQNNRVFDSSFPSVFSGQNAQAEIIHRHRITPSLEVLSGINLQAMAFEEEGQLSADSVRVVMVDPYTSLLISLPSGFSLHAGARVNTHSVYGSQFVYNINPSYLFNQSGRWRYKLFASYSTSYITPSLYQLYSDYGNLSLTPEEAGNMDAGLSLYHKGLTLNLSVFKRSETNPIDFVSMFDSEGNWLGARYQNVIAARNVSGIEADFQLVVNTALRFNTYYAYTTTDQPQTFLRIPNHKSGFGIDYSPMESLNLSLKYNYIGDRRVFDFNTFSEVTLDRYQLVDIYASYGLMKRKMTLFGGVNNLFDTEFIGVWGYTTRGRNYSAGLRYAF